MKSDKNILIAFFLNLTFSIIEFIGGIFTKSVAIISDAIHDFGDAISIGLSYFFEKISKKKPNKKYTYGYLRYSLIGAIITNTVLIVGSIFVIFSAIKRILNPIEINYNGMILFAITGFIINLIATYITKDGKSLNQKAVNLHMLEDVLGWLVVLVGAVIIKFTKIYEIDGILSIFVAIFILYNAIKSYKKILDIFLEKTPKNIDVDMLKKHLLEIKNVIDIHHIHVWSIDGITILATLHIVTDAKDINMLKNIINEKLKDYNINHITIQFEEKNNNCRDIKCTINNENSNCDRYKH